HADQCQQRESAPAPRLADGRQGRPGADAVTRRRLSAFIDAIAAGRRPKRFRAEADDAELVRTAISLRAARPGDSGPTDDFVEGPHYNGRIECMLKVHGGATVAFGTFTVHHGVGQFSRSIDAVKVGRLQSAQLVDSSGSPVATATFPA